MRMIVFKRFKHPKREARDTPVVFTVSFAIVLRVLYFHHIKGADPMKLEGVKEIARERGIPLKKMKKTELIRTIQRNEGNFDCYNTDSSTTCGQLNCIWRDDCK